MIRSTMIYHRPLSLLYVALLFLVAASANAALQLELVQIVHRTGVVAPNAATPNRTKMCSPDGSTNCSAIANLGVQQVAAMGEHIARLYSGDADAALPPYDPHAVEAHALGAVSEVQAAGALLRGLFGAPALSPVVFAAAAASGKGRRLDADACPAIALANEAQRAAARAQAEAVVDREFADGRALAEMGAEVGVEAMCADHAQRAPCALALAELADMYAATNQANAAPKVMGEKEKLRAVAEAHRRAVYGYSAEDEEMAARGSFGEPLAQELVKNMRGKMAAADSAAYNSNVVMQYTHRVPFGTAVGSVSSDVPPVAETFLLDLLRDKDTGAFFVRLRYAAAPTGKPATSAFPFRCLSESGALTNKTSANGVTCPFEDFARFVNSTTGTDEAGASCYLDKATKEELDCQVHGAPPSEACAAYRAMCPAQACAVGSVYDVSDASCVFVRSENDSSRTGMLIAVCFSVTFAAFALAILAIEVCPVLFGCIRRRCSKNQESESDSS